MRKQVLSTRTRIDGRATDEIRFIDCRVSQAANAHGSALFTRGETQTFVTAALGMEMDSQRIDYAGTQEQFRRWMLTYNFPPFCTGEARMLRGPKRREIGHGVLAHRSIIPVLPSQEDFPYVLRCCPTFRVQRLSHGQRLRLDPCADGCWCAPAPVAGIAI